MKITQPIPDFISSSLFFSTLTPLICRTGDFVLFVMIGRRQRGRPGRPFFSFLLFFFIPLLLSHLVA